MEDVKSTVHTCFHCGNTGILEYIGKSGWQEEQTHKDVYGNVVSHYVLEQEDWYVFACPVCHKPVIISEYTFGDGVCGAESKIEYPTIAVSPIGVPKEIYSAYEAAVKTKGIDHAICLLSLRRVLEMMCKDKGAKGNNLEEKITFLINEKILPPMVEDACWVIRKLGNAGAHADNLKIYISELEQVIGYVATIIDYLYSLPRRVAIMKDRIAERKNASQK